MDTFTHALSGALLCRAAAFRRPTPASAPVWSRVVVGFVAAAFPDIDYLASFFSPLTYLLHHRGITHSVVLLPVWAWLLAYLAGLAFRQPRGWRAYYGAAALGLAAHIAGDLITSFGTVVFAPLSQARFAWGTTFIIDLWFSGIVLAGLILSGVWRKSRIPAVAASLVLAGYVGFQAVLKQQAVEIGAHHAQAAGLQGSEVSAHPGPVSPFNWAVYVRSDNEYRYAFINLARRERLPEPGPQAGLFERVSAPHHPPGDAQWGTASLFGADDRDVALAREAWSQPSLQFFRWFAEYPALYRIDRGNPSECVWFYDLRFFRPGSERLPFRYGLCREHGGPWQRYQLVGDHERVPFD
jgi:inner membrane protein